MGARCAGRLSSLELSRQTSSRALGSLLHWVQYELPEMLKRPVYHLLHHVASVDVLLKAGMANHVRKREVDRLRTVRLCTRLEIDRRLRLRLKTGTKD